jgi:hypothetical protein
MPAAAATGAPSGSRPSGICGALAPGWLDTTELDELNVARLVLSYRDGVFRKDASLRLDAFELAASSASQPMRVRAEGALAGAK